MSRVKNRGCCTLLKSCEANCDLWVWAIQTKFDWLIEYAFLGDGVWGRKLDTCCFIVLSMRGRMQLYGLFLYLREETVLFESDLLSMVLEKINPQISLCINLFFNPSIILWSGSGGAGGVKHSAERKSMRGVTHSLCVSHLEIPSPVMFLSHTIRGDGTYAGT